MKKIILLMLFLFSVLILKMVSAYDINNPVHYFEFEDNLNDSIGNASIVNSSDFYYVTGKNNTAINFSSTSNRINDFTNYNNYTLAFWFKPSQKLNSSTSPREDLFLDSASNGFTVSYNLAANSGNLTCGNHNKAENRATYHVEFSANTWYHIACNYNNTDVSLWINGAKVATRAGGNYDADNPSIVDIYANGNDGNLTVDSLKFWDVSLSDTETRDIYNDTSAPFINITYPLNKTYYRGITALNTENEITITWNISDSRGIDSCSLWNGTANVSVTCDENYTMNISYLKRPYHFVLYANDTNGNFNAYPLDTTFAYYYLINNITTNFTGYATDRKTFEIKFYRNTNLYDYSTAELVYNSSTRYLIDKGAGNLSIFNYTLDLNAQEGEYPFYWIIEQYNSSDDATVSFVYIDNDFMFYSNVTPINLSHCTTDFNITALNFTFWDELTDAPVNSAANLTSISAFFQYWIGSGTEKRNYTFSNISSTTGEYQFCINPYNSTITFKTDMIMDYSALGYSDNEYLLNNATLTNITSNILLQMLTSADATKFYITVRQGTSEVDNGIVTVQKYMVADGSYETVAIKETDDVGKFSMYQELDAKYKYIVIKDGAILGAIEKVSSCTSTPCELTIFLEEAAGEAFQGYYDVFASNTASNISFNAATNIVTYTFIDTTGLANYFRLAVNKVSYNQTKGVICDKYLYSSSGTLTCNLTGYTGEFIAKGYVSRSPELLDQILNFMIDEDVISDLGLDGVFFTMILLMVFIFAGAVAGKGNPSTILVFLGLGILLTKLISIFPFGWITVSILEVLIFFMLYKIRI